MMVKLHPMRFDGKVPIFPFSDYEHSRWKSKCFLEKSLDPFCSLKEDFALHGELEALAKEADPFPKTIIYCEFQSRNVILFRNKVYLIDYQDAGLGLFSHDFVTLVFDSYVEISPLLREIFLRFYKCNIYKKRIARDSNFEEELSLRSLLGLKIQRHLQALGVFANLALVRGKLYFLKCVSYGIRYLKEEVNSMLLPILKAYLERVKVIFRKRGVF